MILPVKPFKAENGSAVLFSVTGSLIALALAFILMLSTTQTLNLAFFNNNDLKLSSTVETGTNTAVALINSGYDFTQHDSTNPYISERTINDDGTPQVIEKISWHVEPVNLTNTTFCTDSFNTYAPGEMEVVVVGGGGSGGGSIGGGGGAGGFIEQTVQLEAGEYIINVGAGGASAQPEEAGETGEDSTAFGLTALGGGGGAAVQTDGTIMSPLLGGSGGGATINDITGTAQQSGALGAAGQGNPGGDSHTAPSSSAAAAGGGGAVTSGSDGALNNGGDGGAGIASTITGTGTFYAAGGGGAAPENQTPGAGGSNIGGTGSAGTTISTEGEQNTGSGGGGNYSLTTGESGEGGSGIVIVRYPTQIGETTVPALALGGTVEEIEISDTTYRVHSFTTTGESTFNLITTGDSKYNCGYTLTVTAEMPLYSDAAKMTAQTTLTPFQYGEASTGDVITYNPTRTSLLRNGIHANGNLTFSQNSKLYSYYSNDNYTNSSVLISPNSNLDAASLSSGEQITVNSTNISEATIANTTLYNVSGSDMNSYINAGCVINSVDCSETIKNIQNYKISDTTHDQWVEQQCDNPETSFSSTETIPKGVTCVETSNMTLGSNFVEGDYENPSILIVKGSLNFDSDITLNPAKAPRTLQIYVQGNITNTEATNSNSTINATLVTTGTTGNILLEETNTDSDITFNGATYSSGNTEFKGNVNVWQDLNLKFTRNVDDFVVYQKGGRETTEYVREQFNISNPGGAFGDTWNPDTQPENINPAQQGGE